MITEIETAMQPTLHGFSLSPQQARAWAWRAGLGSAQVLVRVAGALDEERLAAAIQSTVERHEILRTVFRSLPGMSWPLQVVTEPRADRTPQERSAKLAEWLRTQEALPFDLEDGPVLRVSSIGVEPGERLLRLALPALCSDLAGLDNLVREIVGSYRGAGALDPEAEPPVQYADLSTWQNSLLEGEETLAERGYWFERTSVIEAPFPPGAEAGKGRFLPQEFDFALGAPALAKLRSIAQAEGAELSDLLLACWVVFLGRLVDRQDLSVGVAFDGRDYQELAATVGPLVRFLPLAWRLESSGTLQSVLRQVRRTLGVAFEMQRFLDWQALAARDENPQELVQTYGFEMEKPFGPAEEVSGVTFTVVARQAWSEPFRLKLSCRAGGDSLALRFAFDAAVFSLVEVRRWALQLEALLISVAAAPGALIGDLALVGEVERHRLVRELNDTSVEPSAETLPGLFAAQAERTPERIAVEADGASLTYAELDRRTVRLAEILRSRGAGPDTLVGICLERGLEMVVALLGTLRAGAAYLPLDPSHPEERLAQLVQDADPRLVLTRSEWLARLSVRAGNEVLDLDRVDLSQGGGRSGRSGRNGAVDPANLAYVIYTSGSSGRPKGVAVAHAAIVNRLLWMQRRFPLAADDRVLQKTTFTFDASIWEIFLPLATGAGLFLARPDGQRDNSYLIRAIAEQEITVLQWVPSQLRVILEEPGLSSLSALRRVYCGGEALPADLRDRFFELLTGVALCNLYGPTESSIDASFWPLRRESGESPVPIGRPIDNVRVSLYDAGLWPVPAGAAGEVAIAGIGLARGYLGRPDLTAERFVPDPLAERPGERLYRTGDLARRRLDGAVEYLGRIDHQVKVRGFRIELGEIEAALRLHPGVRDAVVALRGEAGNPRLVAYVATRRDLGSEAGELLLLPNGMEIAHLNRNEAVLIFREIFEDEVYLRHGVNLADGDCVFDVGANIGLFTLFAHQRAKNPKVFAFEPVPAVFKRLESNVGLYGLEAKLFNCGLADAPREAVFTFYPRWSAMSGLYADLAEDERVARASLESQDADLARYADELLSGRFEAESFSVPLRTVSDVLVEEGLARIDLLKIDVEKSELDVLCGIRAEDWPKIGQIVVELHAADGRLEAVETLLRDQGYTVVAEEDARFRGAGLFNVYAVRPAWFERRAGRRTAENGLLERREATPTTLRGFLDKKLPAPMIPSTFVLLDALPRTASGKIDRSALPEPDAAPPDEESFDRPYTPVEELVAGIWCEVLGLERIRVDGNFFLLGGHSLLLTQVISRLRETFRVDLPLRTLFESPTIAETAQRVEHEMRVQEGLPLPPLVASPRDGELPLSFPQQRLWLLDQMDPGNLAYVIPGAFRLTGALNVAALRDSFTAIVARHESLRTTFHAGRETPIQVVEQAAPMALPLIDLARLARREREREGARRWTEASSWSFDLRQGPLLRLSLLRLGEREHVLSASMHHIVSDGWSFGILIRELGEIYSALAAGAKPRLPDLPIQYPDFAVWQRRGLAGENLEAMLGFWRSRLAGARSTLDLPIDRPRPPGRTMRGATEVARLEPAAVAALYALTRADRATLFMVLLAGFQTLLYRYTGQEDLTVGSPIAGRNRPEIEPLIGFFVNTLVFRADLVGNPSFHEQLRRTREAALAAYAHPDLPFEKLVEELQPEGVASPSPLFSAWLALQNVPAFAIQLPGLTLEPIEVATGTAKFDLHLALVEDSYGALTCALEYATDLFDRTTILRLLTHFGNLLRQIGADPGRRISELPLARGAELHQLRSEWNDTSRPGPATAGTLLARLSAVAAADPAAVALIFENRRMSFAELHSRAVRLASYLRAQGVGPEARVGVFFERTPELLVALFGILGAGASFVPLEPDYPAERLAYMITDSGAAWLLTNERLASRLPQGGTTAPQLLCLDADWDRIAGLPVAAERVDAADAGEHLAYVLYTSGSTGRPKGVMIPRRGLDNYLRWAGEAYRAAEGAGAPAYSPIGFDLTLTSLLLPLLAGRPVTLLAGSPVGGELAKVFLGKPDFGLVKLTPAHLDVLRQQLGGDERAGATRVLIVGGEALHGGSLAEWRRDAPETRLINEYGPTETVVGCAVHEIPGDDALAGPVPIGRPIDRTELYVLEPGGGLAPVGIAGELAVGGEGLARGYLGRPALTAAAFVPHPHGRQPGARLYRTGDLARRRPDGVLDFLGRFDTQVKVRGFRIELGEIEAVLVRHPALLEVAVVVRDEGADASLAAFVVARPGIDLEALPGKLRDFLRLDLPEHMVPSSVVGVESLPLTANGKVDRKILKSWTSAAVGVGAVEAVEAAGVAEPRTDLERTLVGLWRDLLKRPEIGIDDNFFELGGHSMHAVRLVARIRKALGSELMPGDLLDHPTVAKLASHLESRIAAAVAEAPPIRPAARDRDLPLSFAQQRLWLVDRLDPSAAYNSPSALRLVGRLDLPVVARTLGEVVRRHEVLRTRFPEIDGRPVQRIAPAAALCVPVVDLASLPAGSGESEVRRSFDDGARRIFDLSRGPLLRCRLLRLGGQEHVLLFTLHHIVTDAWSSGVFIREVAALYEAFSQGLPSPLGEPPIQYADYASWQREWLQGAALSAQLLYWKQQLAGDPPVIDLAAVLPRPTETTETPEKVGVRRSFVLPEDLAARLRDLSRTEGVTLFMTLLAGFQALLSRLTGVEDVVVGTATAGRDRLETEGLIGFFVNLLAMRTDLSGNPKFRELLARARTTALGAYAHQELPFDLLVQELRPGRELLQTPFLRIAFSLNNVPLEDLALPGLRLTMLEPEPETARFDLTVWVREADLGLTLDWTWRSELFDLASIESLERRFEALLSDAVERPDARLSSLETRTAAERAEQGAEEKRREAEKMDRFKPKRATPAVEARPAGREEPEQ